MLILPGVAFSQEYRAEAGFSYDINDLEISAAFQGRTGINENQSYTSGLTQLAVDYKLYKRFDVGISFRHTISEETASFSENSIDNENKNRLTFDLGADTKRFDNEIKIKTRLRYQLNRDDDGDQKAYIREKITFDYKLTGLLRPYAALEIYYHIQEQELRAYRLYLGSEFDMDKHKLDFYYILEANVSERTDLFYMLGVAYKFGV